MTLSFASRKIRKNKKKFKRHKLDILGVSKMEKQGTRVFWSDKYRIIKKMWDAQEWK